MLGPRRLLSIAGAFVALDKDAAGSVGSLSIKPEMSAAAALTIELEILPDALSSDDTDVSELIAASI